MGGLFGGGGGSQPVGAGTSGTPGNQFAQYYQPQGQPGADTQYQNLLNTLYGQYASGSTPSAFYSGQGQNQSEAAFNLINGPQSFAGAIPGTVAGNPYAQEGIDAAQYVAQNIAPEITGAIPGILSSASALQGTAPQLLASGFDPQSALYNSEANKVDQAAVAANAASGVSGPYAASTINDATGNFETNWQNQQLQRQLSGAQGAAGAAGAGANLISGLPSLAGGALALKQAPGQAYLGQQQATEAALSNYLSQVLQSQGATTGGFNIGQAGYQLPESLLSNLGNYLKLGQNASLGSADLGQIGSQQASQGLSGLTGLGVLGTNALFGQNSPFAFGGGAGGGLVGGLSGLAGGGGVGDSFLSGGATGGSTADAFLTSGLDQGAVDAGGGGLGGFFSGIGTLLGIA